MTGNLKSLAIVCGALAIVASGCAGTAPAPPPEAGIRALAQAPTARELETPFQDNGNNNALRIQRHGNGAIEESVRVPTAEVRGQSAFPGVDVDLSRVPGETPPPRAPAPAPMPTPAPEEALRLASQMAAIEARLAEIEGRAPEAVTADPAEAAEQYARLERRLAALEGRVPAAEDRPPDYASAIARLEERLAEVEARAERVIDVTPRNYEQQLARLETRLAAIEERPAAPPAAEGLEASRAAIASLEARLAEVEGRPPRTVEVRADAHDQLLETLQTRVAALEGRPAPVASVTPENFEAEFRRLEERLASLEGRPAPAPSVTPEDLDAEFRGIDQRLASLEDRPAPAPSVTPEDLDAEFRGIDQRLAALEDEGARRARLPVQGDHAEQVAALQERVRALESGTGTERIAAVEERLAAVESRGPGIPGVNGSIGHALGHAPDGLMPSAGGYRIGAGDLLEFQSFNDELLNREVTVRFDGHISLPLIPDQPVAGSTREEAEDRLRSAYGRVFRDPQLALVVQETGSKTFTVMGDVERPAHYPYTRATSLLDAITDAGGLRNRNAASSVGGFIGITGQLTKAFVIRRTADGRDVYEYDLRHLGRPGYHASEAPVFPGDVIYVPEGVNLVYVLGESRNPVIVELTEGMTLLQMLALSGGFNASTAQLRNVLLLREVNAQETDVMRVNVRQMLRTGERIYLHPGDIVYIPQKRLVRLQEFVARMTGSVAPVIDLYTSAVDAYYARDLNRALLDATRGQPQNNTLRVLNQIEGFGNSTQNIVDLFGRP